MINSYVTKFLVNQKYFTERKLGKIKKSIDNKVHSEPATSQNVSIPRDWVISKTSVINILKTNAMNMGFFVSKIALTPEKCNSINSFVYTKSMNYITLYRN